MKKPQKKYCVQCFRHTFTIPSPRNGAWISVKNKKEISPDYLAKMEKISIDAKRIEDNLIQKEQKHNL